MAIRIPSLVSQGLWSVPGWVWRLFLRGGENVLSEVITWLT